MATKSNTTWLSSLLWGIFALGIMESMFIFLFRGDYLTFFSLGTLLGISMIVSAIKTYQPKIGYYHEIAPYLIHPVFLLIGLVSFLIFNENLYLQQTAIIFTLLGYMILFSENYSDFTHKAHDGVKFIIILFLYDSVIEAINYLGLNVILIPLFITLITLLLLLHMLWRLKAHAERYFLLSLLSAIAMGVVSYFLTSYYLFASFLNLSVILLTIYYVFWGILHHLIERNLTMRILIEYLLIAGIIISMILGLLTGW